MSSREKILTAVKASQPVLQPQPEAVINAIQFNDAVAQFEMVLKSIGGNTMHINNTNAINEYVKNTFPSAANCVTTIAPLSDFPQLANQKNPHALANIDVAVLPATMGVAENGAAWLTEEDYTIRALPFICQHLIIVLPQQAIVQNMHEAYKKINTARYGFGVFIAGPSKTADIEQSLVLGAHGPKTMTVFLLS